MSNPKDSKPAAAEEEKEVPWICTKRVALAMVGCLGFINLYALRVNMSVALVCMVNHTAVGLLHQTGNHSYNSSHHSVWNDANHTAGNGSHLAYEEEDDGDRCSLASTRKRATADGQFVWDKELQGVILGAFFWGYLITQIPGGLLSQKFGGKRVLGYFLLVAAIATLFSSLGARASPYLLIFLRFVIGLGQGVVFPSMHNLWANWAPPLERSKLIGFTQAGAQMGNVLAMPISAVLCDYGFDGGWGSIFYIFGTYGIIWFVIWMFVVSDSPAKHPTITEAERNYVQSTIGHGSHHLKLSETPWLAFAKSGPVWAIVVAHTCAHWGTYTLLTNMPAYMKEVLKFDIKSNGLFSAIPYISYWLFINIGGVLADYMRQHGMKTRTVRKIMLNIGMIGPAVLLVATGYVKCQYAYVAVAVLSLAVGMIGFQTPGVLVNHVDIAPPFAGVLFGISNTAATIPGFAAPYTIKKVTIDSTQEQWQIVFYIAAVIYVFGAVFFSIFADGEVQEWARPYMAESIELPQKSLKEIPPDEEANGNVDAAPGYRQ